MRLGCLPIHCQSRRPYALPKRSPSLISSPEDESKLASASVTGSRNWWRTRRSSRPDPDVSGAPRDHGSALGGGTVSFESEHTRLTNIFIHPTCPATSPANLVRGNQANAAMWAGQHGMNLAIGFAPNEKLFGAPAAFRHGIAMRQTRNLAEDEVRRGQIALMRQVYVGESAQQVKREMVADLMRLGELNEAATAETGMTASGRPPSSRATNRGEHLHRRGTRVGRPGDRRCPQKPRLEPTPRQRLRRRDRTGARSPNHDVLAGPVRAEIDRLTTRI